MQASAGHEGRAHWKVLRAEAAEEVDSQLVCSGSLSSWQAVDPRTRRSERARIDAGEQRERSAVAGGDEEAECVHGFARLLLGCSVAKARC